jgi:4-amino-4-deoxy-L-arabinose transferase-like glycosyltransferase
MNGLASAPSTSLQRLRRLADPELLGAAAAPAAAAALTLLFVVPTLAPGISSWDTAEFQTVGPVLGTAHPTGYPAYVILGWLASIVLQPFGDPAFRMNLLQAVLAALAVAGTVALVQLLTGRRLIALAVGLVLACTQLFWRLSTHADPHMFHVALLAILFAVLVVWDQRRRSANPDTVKRADRWLVAAAVIFGVAVANHSLALLLPPAIGLYVLACDPRIIFRWRTIVACLAALAFTITVLFLELPIRAAMHAPLVYGHPDTWSGFWYVTLGQQFTGSLSDPFGNLSTKAASVMDLMTGWVGPLAMLAAVGLVTSLVRRPRYLLLSGLTLVATCVFSASYANAEIDRYYLVPLMVVLTWAALGTADVITMAAWAVNGVRERFLGVSTAAGAVADAAADEPATAPDAPSGVRRRDDGWTPWLVLAGEFVVAAALVFPVVGIVPQRQQPQSGANPGGASEANKTGDAAWLRAVLAPADKGGLPKDSVIMSWWSTSTTLWYGQKVLGMRPDIYIVDDRTRLDDNLGEVQDVFNKFLGNRPVFTIRLKGGPDGMNALSTEYDIRPYTLGDGSKISQVVGRKGK